ncbi:MAG TPA: hypothetical protein DCE41_36240 [Cytophagales bacterium]|nr:hypothetical protein [Cytophagales bacterium]HAA20806.1 hypothetical protein [Cytophagales bacterium]HAP59095.1 hypothetical protein [Cytophagales bacterium]
MIRKKTCDHLKDLEPKPIPAEPVCEECVKIGGSWVHLRMCNECGKVHCCDSSPHKHATAHHKETGHAVVLSAEPGERWAWCYVDKVFQEY